MKRFSEAIIEICENDERYHKDAYHFLKEALDFTLNKIVSDGGELRHISGAELLHGFKDLALKEYGPLAKLLLNEWGILKTRDVGEMVFNLVGANIFGKQEDDRREDFDEIYQFDEAFSSPFTPFN